MTKFCSCTSSSFSAILKNFNDALFLRIVQSSILFTSIKNKQIEKFPRHSFKQHGKSPKINFQGILPKNTFNVNLQRIKNLLFSYFPFSKKKPTSKQVEPFCHDWLKVASQSRLLKILQNTFETI